MIHKVLEELFDILMFFVGVFGILIFCLLYWKNAFQIRYAEVILQEFLGQIAITGKMTKDDYERIQRNLYEIDEKYDLTMQTFQYQEQPVYSLITKEKLSTYFQERNIVKSYLFKEYIPPLLPELNDELKLQTETNASVLAAEEGQGYLPLPVENKEIMVTVVRPRQEVYENEKLITVCKVISSGTSYYVEAGEIVAKESGNVNLNVQMNGAVYQVPIQVICHPRTIQCGNGHTINNDEGIIEEIKQTGIIPCPYCKILPEKIFCGVPDLHIKTGTELTEENIRAEVVYQDGSIGYITPEMQEWQDDYDKNFCGKQSVTIRYRNAETHLMVISENDSCLQCGKECNDRCSEDYLDYPYCLDCLSEMYLFTGQVKAEESIITGKELLFLLDTEHEVIFKRGDFFVLELRKGKYKILLQKEVLIDGIKRIR